MGWRMKSWSETWTFVDGNWLPGNPPLTGPRSHAFWLGTSVFDGARYFEGVIPDLDLHCARLNASAPKIGLKAMKTVEEMTALAWEGVKKFPARSALYIKPMYWAEYEDGSAINPDAETTRFCLCIFEAVMPPPTGWSVTLSPYRRPTIECAPTDAKTGALYPNNARALREAKSRGFANALVRDFLGNIAETCTSNVFMVKDGVVRTPMPNGTFLNGITRQRVIGLLRGAGYIVEETSLTYADFQQADEIFSTGNYSKVVPINKIDERDLQPGPITKKARDLYMEFARS